MLFTESKTGKKFWIPIEKVVFLEAADGFLTTLVHMFPFIGPKGMALNIQEVDGTVADNAAKVEIARTTLVAAGKSVETQVPA